MRTLQHAKHSINNNHNTQAYAYIYAYAYSMLMNNNNNKQELYTIMGAAVRYAIGSRFPESLYEGLCVVDVKTPRPLRGRPQPTGPKQATSSSILSQATPSPRNY
jgi:hypothetical protein